jgi:peptidyl-prolyl cis-trans isomerase SurA
MTMPLKTKILKFTGAKLLIPLILCAAQGLFAQDKGGFVVDKIIAKVDNYIVLKSELDQQYQRYLVNGGSPSQEARCGMLAQLISGKLMVAKAEIDSVIVADVQVEGTIASRMQMVMEQYGGSIEQIEQIYGKSIEQFKSEMRDQVKEQMLIQKMQEEITKDIVVTPAEVRKFFNRIPKDSLPFFSAEVEVAQIVKLAEISEKQKDIVRKELLDLREQIVSGADFAALARKFSHDPSARYNGGDLGYASRGMMVPEFEAVALRLNKGELSMPIESPFGFHLIQLIDRRGNEYNARHILLMPTPSEDDLKNAKLFLDSIRNLIVKEETTFQKMAKEHSDDMETKLSGGFFTDESGSTRVSVDDLDPVVFFSIDSISIGSITRPIAFRTYAEKEAMRILYYKSRMRPHQANLRDDWQRIQNAALASKNNNVINDWFERARQDVFIYIDPEYDNCAILD